MIVEMMRIGSVIILIVAQKNYVLNALLGDRPTTGADADIMNVRQAQSDDYTW